MTTVGTCRWWRGSALWIYAYGGRRTTVVEPSSGGLAVHGPFDLEFETRFFPAASSFPGQSPLNIGWQELVLAVVTVGRWPPHVFQHGHYSLAEVLHRAHCLLAYYETVGTRLRCTPAAMALDPSERGIAGYYLGMSLAKVVAARHLGTPYLMHVSRYGVPWAVQYVGPRRPDLFGPAPNGWLVAEAKGRQRIRTKLIEDMVEQKSSVATINGVAPGYRIGVATRTRRGDHELLIVDPDANERGDHLVIDRDDWIAAYYRPVRRLVEDFPSETTDDVRWGSLPDVDIQVGIPEPIIDALAEHDDRNPKNIPPSRDPIRPQGIEPGPLESVVSQIRADRELSDGLLIKLGPAWE